MEVDGRSGARVKCVPKRVSRRGRSLLTLTSKGRDRRRSA